MTKTKAIQSHIMDSLANHFLIAMPQLADPNFAHTVTYICEHNDQGAMGIIVNRPLELNLGDILDQLQIDADTDDGNLRQQPVVFGGPVHQEYGFVLHDPGRVWRNTLFISDDVALTTSNDILHDIAVHNGPDQSLVALGYAGWGAGQLETEMSQNAWLSVAADADIIFLQPFEQRWQASAQLLGIDISVLSDNVGHA